MGHNPNTLDDALSALEAGANALEPDLNILPAGAIAPFGKPVPNGIVLYHDYTLTPTRVPLTLVQYLDGLHGLAKSHPDLALILFDVKPSSRPSKTVPTTVTTTVNSTAQDPSGNQASCSFTVHVKGAVEQLADLIAAVTNLSAKEGTSTSLLAKLQTALAKVQANDTAACGTLVAFINEVTSHSGKDISVVDADALIAKATQIRIGPRLLTATWIRNGGRAIPDPALSRDDCPPSVRHRRLPNIE